MASVPQAADPPESESSFRPASTDVPDAEYPRIDEQRRVQFRIKAPDAQRGQITVGGGGETRPFRTDDWPLTT
jgi:hypothetical protein